jgi:hypothetical protein
MSRRWAAGLCAALTVGLATTAGAQPADSTTSPARPFVPGGYNDKPYLEGVFGRIRLGGYVEGNGAWEREDGVTSELGFELTRWNLLASTDFGRRVQVFSEVEIEEAGAEITLELAQIDLLLTSTFNLRGGMLLLPLGKFNLAHDAPRNELPTRPAEAEQLLGVALSQPGIGGFGRAERGASRFTWELYGVNGYHAGLLTQSSDGTRLPEGRHNPEDGNASPAVVGRVEWGHGPHAALGVSGYHGAYNVYRLEGVSVDTRRDVAVAALDAEWPIGPLTLSGEAAHVRVDIPPALAGIFASRQGGLYVQAVAPVARFDVPSLDGLLLTAALRVDAVDFDRDLPGDSMRSWTVGLNLRPVPETAFKLAYARGETRDRFDNLSHFAQIQLALATYF